MRLFRARHHPSSTLPAENFSVTYQPPNIFLQGDMWVATLPAFTSRKDGIRIVANKDGTSKDHWRRKDTSDDCIQIYPSRRRAHLQNNVLTLVAEDGCEERILMKGCSVLSVSAGDTDMSRKWAKEYPIQLESINLDRVMKRSVRLLYFKTSWKKERWCQVLRAAAGWTTEKENWYIGIKRQFYDYCSCLDKAYPSFAKATRSKSNRLENEGARLPDRSMTAALSKRQRIWRKFKKVSSKKSTYVSEDWGSSLSRSKSEPEMQDGYINQPFSLEGSFGCETAGSSSLQSKPGKNYVEDSHSLSDSSKGIDYRILPDLVTTVSDQGTLCWSLLCSRLFFDGYHNLRFQEACHKFIQNQFSKNVNLPYLGKINCTELELGPVPPIIHSMQVLPQDSDFISFEAVVEYSGGAQIKINTRLDVRDSASQEKVLTQSLEPTLAGAAAADILRAGLKTVEDSAPTNVVRSTDSESGEAGADRAQPSKGRWKTMLARVANQISLVPITLSIRIVSIKGTICVRIKPPPTDRVWFGFTSMPTIELQLEPSIGEHRISKGPVIPFITNKIKMLIQDALVLPHCEEIGVPWMVSEKQDWIPKTAMPVPWKPVETPDSLTREDTQVMRDAWVNAITEPVAPCKFGNVDSISEEPNQRQDLEKPIFKNRNFISDGGSPSSINTTVPAGRTRFGNIRGNDGMDANKRSSKRKKMLNLGRKVTEKLDEMVDKVVDKVVDKMREGFEKFEHCAM